MYSPEPTPRPARMTLGPRTFPSESGSGMSRYGIGGRLPFGTGSKYAAGETPAWTSESLMATYSTCRSVFAELLLRPRASLGEISIRRDDGDRERRAGECVEDVVEAPV